MEKVRTPLMGIFGLLGGSMVLMKKNRDTSSFSQAFTALHQWSSQKQMMKHHQDQRKHAVVVGAGVAGVCSAYELSKEGYEVIVVEAASGPGMECSAVAAGGMQRSNPVVDRAKWKAITTNVLGSWGGKSSEFRYFYMDWMNVLTDPHFLRWSVDFALYSLMQPETLLHQQREMLKFTTWAIDQFNEDKDLKSVNEKAYVQNRGALMLNKTAHSAHCVEPRAEILDSGEAIRSIEPFVGQWMPGVSKAVYQPQANSGNSELFTKALAEKLEREHDVIFYYNTKVEKIHSEGKRVTMMELSNQKKVEFDSSNDQLVVAAGSWTPNLLWQMDIYAPIYPLKGYCIEIPNENKTKITGILSDEVTFFSRLGKDLRIAAVGEFGGWNSTPTKAVDEAFRKYVTANGIDVQGHPTRCGLRPMSADGAVIIGKVDGWDNLAINTGPGSNGWKIAPGAAKIMVDSIENRKPSLPFDSSSLSCKGRVKSALIWSKLSLLRHYK